MSELRGRLQALRVASGEVFDGPGLGLVEALLTRGEALGGQAGARLHARAAERAGRIEAALARALGEASRELEAMGPEAPSAAKGALERGDPRAARRAIRQARFEAARSGETVAVPWAARLGGEASLRGEEGLSRELARVCASGVVGRSAHREAVALGGAASSALFRASAESARATVAIARTSDNLPEDAGPYNSQVLAARALARLAELSPAYAAALVAVLDDLAGLEAQLGPEPSRTRPRVSRAKRAAV